MDRRKNEKRFFLGVILCALSAGQLSSFLVETYIVQGHSIEVIPFLRLTHIRNLGGIFGVFQGKGWLFALISLFLLSGLIGYILRMGGLARWEYLCFGLVAGGGLSNVVDRLIYGSVIDFIDVRGIPFWEYIFNTADVMIHLGVWPLMIYGFLHRKKETPKLTKSEGPDQGFRPK